MFSLRSDRPFGHFWAGQVLLLFLPRRQNKIVRASLNPMLTTRRYCRLNDLLLILLSGQPRFQTNSLHLAREPGMRAS